MTLAEFFEYLDRNDATRDLAADIAVTLTTLARLRPEPVPVPA